MTRLKRLMITLSDKRWKKPFAEAPAILPVATGNIFDFLSEFGLYPPPRKQVGSQMWMLHSADWSSEMNREGIPSRRSVLVCARGSRGASLLNLSLLTCLMSLVPTIATITSTRLSDDSGRTVTEVFGLSARPATLKPLVALVSLVNY